MSSNYNIIIHDPVVSNYNNIVLMVIYWQYVVIYTMYTKNARSTIKMKSNALLLHLSGKLI